MRLVVAPVTLAVQLYLYDRLWTAVFSHTTVAAGLTLRQTLTYSLMALLIARVRWNSRTFNVRDSLSVAVREGTVVYWFLRPISPSRFYMWRQSGDMLYGAFWAAIGYVVLLRVHIIAPPRGLRGATVFAASLLLGQMVLYYLGQIVDVAMFWLVSNSAIVRMYYFIQDLLSGVFVPLPFMPVVAPDVRYLVAVQLRHQRAAIALRWPHADGPCRSRACVAGAVGYCAGCHFQVAVESRGPTGHGAGRMTAITGVDRCSCGRDARDTRCASSTR